MGVLFLAVETDVELLVNSVASVDHLVRARSHVHIVSKVAPELNHHRDVGEFRDKCRCDDDRFAMGERPAFKQHFIKKNSSACN